MIIENVCLLGESGEESYSADIEILDGKVTRILRRDKGERSGLTAVPGFVDLHVHFRDPGFTEKETLESGTMAAAAGGFTTVCCMPNTSPAIHSPAVLGDIDRRARRCQLSNVLALTSMTENQTGISAVDLEAMDKAPTLCKELTSHGVCGISEDGKTLHDENLMRRILTEAKRLGLVVMDHPEPETEVAWRDIRLALETGASVHIQHVSRRATVDLIREAKKSMENISCETAPHYFTLTESALREIGPNAKMNPPLGTEEDRDAILGGLADGTIDIIATDHAPHTPLEKSRPVAEAPFGVVGLETCFAVAYKVLVKGGILTLPELVRKMSTAPSRIIGLDRGVIKEGKAADIVLIDMAAEYEIDPEEFFSKGRNTPFAGMIGRGRVEKTIRDGVVIYNRRLSG